MTIPTHALTVKQPWAELVLRRQKTVENRSWPLPTPLIGVPLALHAGASAGELRLPGLRLGSLVGLAYEGGLGQAPTVAERAALTFGAIVGVVVVEAVVRGIDVAPDRIHATAEGGVTWRQAVGPWCWLLRDVVRLSQPVVCRGRLGAWRLSLDLQDAVRAAGVRDERVSGMR